MSNINVAAPRHLRAVPQPDRVDLNDARVIVGANEDSVVKYALPISHEFLITEPSFLFDKEPRVTDDPTPMIDPISRPEIEAKLELIETRMDARVQRIEDRLDARTKSIEDKIDAALNRMELQVGTISKSLTETKGDLRDVRDQLSNAKWWAIGTGIAILLGVWQIVTGINQSTISAIQLGQSLQTRPPEGSRETATVSTNPAKDRGEATTAPPAKK